MRIKVFLLPLIILIQLSLFSQDNKYPADYFISPLEIDLYLSGTFGELRSNHLHAGIDIKTGGGIGKKVFAVADGYVSRIKVSPGGYGKVVYITHPNGYVSVYGHLNRFNDTLGRYVKNIQYKRESFAVEKFPGKDELKVKQGEIIAYTGNSGGSSAPHLHFELREESSQHPVNPLLFESIKVKDTRKPVILEFAIYPVDKQSRINGKNDTVFYSLTNAGAKYSLAGNPKIEVSGKISFGVRAYDPMDEIPNKNGVYKVIAKIDDMYYFGLEMEKASFATTRYLNSLIDYNYYVNKKRRVIRTQIDTNNRLFNYRNVESNGIALFNDSLQHSIKFEVSDVYNNVSSLEVKFQSLPPNLETDVVSGEKEIRSSHYIDFRKEASFELDGISLSFPSNIFYQSFYIDLEVAEYDSSKYSKVYQIHNRFTPINKPYSMSIKPEKIEPGFKDKMYIAVVKGNAEWYIGAKWKDNKITAKSRMFGYYTISIDTIPPEIKPVNISTNKNIAAQKSIKVKIKDRKTGIGKFRATLNGKWILMDYDAKKNLLVYTFDERLQKGPNKFRLLVSDLMKNETVYNASLVY